MTTEFTELLAACGGEGDIGAIRVRATYGPVGGPTSKVFPPTYAIDGKYVTEKRYSDGQPRDAVVLDAPQSQANRCELALLDAAEGDGLTLPYLTVAADIDGTEFKVTSLDAPHRSPDAYFRDAQLADGTAFDDSAIGASLLAADDRRARALFQHSPADLLFGIWNSQRRKRGVRLPRAYTSEIVAFDPEQGRRAAGRLDPYNASSSEVFVDPSDKANWSLNADEVGLQRPKKQRISEIGHGNALADDKKSPGGFAVSGIERTAVVSMGVLRRLRFPDEESSADRAVDAAGRAVIAALGLLADRLAFGGPSVFLRSGCDLMLLTDEIEWVLRGGQSQPLVLDGPGARSLYEEAVAHAASLGLTFTSEPVVLVPKPNLRELLAVNFAAPAVDAE